jgi:hypothetical protein
MKAKLYTKVHGQEHEDLLGTFDAEIFIPPARPQNKRLYVHGKRLVNLPLDTLVSETSVNTFRAEIID